MSERRIPGLWFDASSIGVVVLAVLMVLFSSGEVGALAPTIGAGIVVLLAIRFVKSRWAIPESSFSEPLKERPLLSAGMQMLIGASQVGMYTQGWPNEHFSKPVWLALTVLFSWMFVWGLVTFVSTLFKRWKLRRAVNP